MKRISNIAGVVFFSIVASSTAYAGDAEAGKAKAGICSSCHGINGISVGPQYPNLAGQKEQYLIKALNAYKSGARKDPLMSAMAAPLSDADISDVAAHFSNLK